MIRYFSRMVFIACILTTAIMIFPACAENPAGDISLTTGPLSPGLPSPSNVRIMTGEPAVSSASGNGFPPEFRWAVPGEIGVHAFSIAIDDQDTIYATDPVNHSVWKFTPDGSRLLQWGSAGTGPGEFTAPLGVAVNGSRYVYVTDLDRVHVFSPDGTFMTTWGSAGNNTGEFNSILGIAVNASGYVYTSETRTNRIQVFDPEGTFVTTWGSAGSAPGEFNGPMSIAVNGSGFVFVVDQWNNRIQVFDPSGGFVQSWNNTGGGSGNGNGEFSFPQCIALDRNGYVFVGDAGNNRVQVFDQAGVYVKQFTSSIGLGIAANSSGYVYLTDYSYDRIQIFDPDGAVVSSWGARGDGDGRFFHPWGVAVNTSGYSFVTDSENHRVQVFSPAGDFAGQWGSQGNGAGEFLLPLGIAVNGSGFVYVADSTNNRVQVFDPFGGYVTQWGSFGTSAGQLFDPRGIAVNGSGFVYVTETGNARVQVFTSDGTSLGSWGSQGSGAGEFDGPMGIAVNSSGYVFVADHANNRIQAFDPSGGYVMQVGSAGTGEGMLSFPMGVAVDAGGQVFVADNGNHRVQVFDRNGVSTGYWGSQGTNAGQFYSPAGIAADSHGDVFVAELYNDRIQKFTFAETSSGQAFNVTSLSADPAGNLAAGIPVNVLFTVNITGSHGETFPAANTLAMSTDLDNARWNYTLILDGIESPQPGSAGRTLDVSGWVLSFPPSVRESLNVTLEGYTPPVSSPLNLALVNVTEVDSQGSIVGSAFIQTALVSPGDTPPGDGVIPLCPAGTPFDQDMYPQDTPQSDPMVFECSWNGTGRVFISGNQTSLTGIWADDGYTVTIQPGGATFDAPVHSGVQHPVVDLTSGMTPGVNTFTLVVQNWNGLSMWYGLFPPASISQTPYIVQVINSSEPSAVYANFDAFPVNGSVPHLVQFSDTSYSDNSAITGRAWFFGDETYNQPWIPVTADAPWPKRYAQSSVVLPDGSIVLTGGWNESALFNDTWLSTDSGTTWTLVNASPGWQPRYFHTTVAMPDGSIILMGGTTRVGPGQEIWMNDVWRSEDKGATWSLVTENAGWPGRGGNGFVVTPDGTIVLMGGNTGSPSHDVWVSDSGGAGWYSTNDNPDWSSRWGLSATALSDNSIVIAGGYDGSYRDDVWRTTDRGITWSLMNASAGWPARQYHNMVTMPDNSILLTGGVDEITGYNDVWRSADNGATWTQVNAGAEWSPRYYHNTLVMQNGSVVLIGGIGHPGSNDVWRLDTAGSEEQRTSHLYTRPGTFNVSLQVYTTTGHNRTQNVEFITVTGSPGSSLVANFTADVTEGPAPLAVNFTDSSAGSPVSWNWSFGDGSFSGLQNPAYYYTTSGNYTVNLNVTDAGGNTSSTSNAEYIHAWPGIPIPMIVAYNQSGPAPLTVWFQDISMGSPTSWNWSFGDGEISTGQNPVHTYLNPGLYTVSLTEENAYGMNTSTFDNWITVTVPENPVVANFTADITEGDIPLMVSFSDLSTGAPVSWSWSFGDGSFADVQNPMYIYTAPGNYTVNLTVTDAGGNSSSISNPEYIHVGPGVPVPYFVAYNQSGPAPLTVQFWDASMGSPTSWNWSFGDGEISTGQNPVHTYLNPGLYTVSLTEENTVGVNTTTFVDFVNVTAPVEPVVANFTANRTAGRVPLAIRFTDQSSGSPASWAWSFGDGSNSTLKDPVHTYTSAGNYTVSLTVTGDQGSDTTLRTGYIQATSGTKPVAAFTANKTSGKRPLAVGFTDQSAGSPTSWKWTFGDGTTSTLQNPVHTYSRAGSYTVSLRVTNDYGSDKKSRVNYIRVRAR